MSHQPRFSSLAFALGPYHLECAIGGEKLLLKVVVDETRGQRVALDKMALIGNLMEMEVTCIPGGEEQIIKSKNNSRSQEEFLSNRLEILQNYVSDLQRKMDDHGKSKKDLRQNQQSQKRLAPLPRENLLPSQEIRERGDQQISGIIQKSVNQNVKLELLNDILQEKLLKREGDLLELERSLLQREELIRELAQKLITANMEKQDIFNEYEKILQTNVFHQEEKNRQPVSQIQTKPSEEAQKEEQIIQPLNQSSNTQKNIEIIVGSADYIEQQLFQC